MRQLPARCRTTCLAVRKTTSGTSPGPKAAKQQQQQLQQQQQQQQQQQKSQQPKGAAQESHYDMNFYHYQPWWMQPRMVVAAGVVFMLVALLVDEKPSMKTLVIAAGPVALFWGILLFLLPQQFQKFAVKWIKEHPQESKSSR
jgi:hypothetical protein